MNEKRVLVIELDADAELPDEVTVWGEIDPVDAALWVVGRDLVAA